MESIGKGSAMSHFSVQTRGGRPDAFASKLCKVPGSLLVEGKRARTAVTLPKAREKKLAGRGSGSPSFVSSPSPSPSPTPESTPAQPPPLSFADSPPAPEMSADSLVSGLPFFASP